MEDLLLTFGLLIAGFVLLAVEAFIIPGFGIPGVVGFLLVGGGCVAAWSSRGPVFGVTAIVVSVGFLAVAVWAFSRSRTGKRMVLRQAIRGESADTTRLADLVGKTGEAVSALRPSGTARIDGRRYQVLTDGEFFTAGTPLRVIRVGTNTPIVARLESSGD